MIRVPDDLANAVTAYAGDDGRAWLARLPRLVEELADEWGLTIGAPFRPSGVASLAVAAGEYVLKVQYPDDYAVHEGAALRHYGGRAAVAIHREDTTRRALLLERCRPGNALRDEADDVAARVVAELLTEPWAPPAEGHPFHRLTDGLPRWEATIGRVERLDRALREEAVATVRDLADSPDDTVLHCDLHPGNVLRATRRPWLAIDPKPVVGERAFDLASMLRDRAEPHLVPRRLAIATEVTGLDPQRVRAWALAQSALGAAWSYEVGEDAQGDVWTVAAESLRAL